MGRSIFNRSTNNGIWIIIFLFSTVVIISDTKDLKKLKDYYLYALDKCKDILLFSSIFNDSLIIDDLKIEITNQEEEKQLLQILPKLNYILSLGGFDTPLEYVLNTPSYKQ